MRDALEGMAGDGPFSIPCWSPQALPAPIVDVYEFTLAARFRQEQFPDRLPGNGHLCQLLLKEENFGFARFSLLTSLKALVYSPTPFGGFSRSRHNDPSLVGGLGHAKTNWELGGG